MPMINSNLRSIIYFGFFLRIIISTWNGFFGPSFGAESDAPGFHAAAVAYSSSLVFDKFIMGYFYSYVLGIIYSLITESLFLGSLLSSITWVASALFVVRIMHILRIEKLNQVKAILVYALLPSSIMYTSVTLREVYELLFVNIAVYSVLKIRFDKSTTHWLWLFFSIAGMSVLHGALLIFGLFVLIANFILLTQRDQRGNSLQKLIVFTPLMVLIAYYGMLLITNVFQNLSGNLIEAIVIQQEGSLSTDPDARTYYKHSVEALSSFTDLLLFVPVALFQYLFEPMPWHISATIDLVSLSENILRAWLIWWAWLGFQKMPIPNRKRVYFVLISYFVIETIWSIGTINWGTAIRHHLPSEGLLVIIAFAYSGNKGALRK